MNGNKTKKAAQQQLLSKWEKVQPPAKYSKSKKKKSKRRVYIILLLPWLRRLEKSRYTCFSTFENMWKISVKWFMKIKFWCIKFCQYYFTVHTHKHIVCVLTCGRRCRRYDMSIRILFSFCLPYKIVAFCKMRMNFRCK